MLKSLTLLLSKSAKLSDDNENKKYYIQISALAEKINSD